MSDSEEETVEKQLKVVFIGDPNVGKTSIIRRFCYDEFTRQYQQTVGADFYIKRIVLPEKQFVTLRISDIGGQELNGSMLDKYLFNSNIIVIAYDITNSTSFDSLINWINTVQRITGNLTLRAVIGNKCDLEHQRKVRLDKTRQFVDQQKILNYLVSAKSGESVSASLTDLVAHHLGIPLTKVQKEHQQSIVKAELVPSPRIAVRPANTSRNSTSVCSIQ